MHRVVTADTNCLALHRGTTAVYCENHRKQGNMLGLTNHFSVNAGYISNNQSD
jgi:hypothetical protein